MTPDEESLIGISDPISAIVSGVLALLTKLTELEILRESKMSPTDFNELTARNAKWAALFTDWMPDRKKPEVPK